ncbi:MAG: LysR family transcriptional regulator [Sedimentitalea sp.]
MIDRLRQMAIFSKTIDQGSFRGAARELNLSPSVFSHHVSQLEEHLGVALLYRSTRKLSLTPDGERLLDATHKMLDAVEGELEALSSSARQPSGAMRITLPSVLSQSMLTQKIAAYSVAHPRVDITLDFSGSRRELFADGFDLAIRMGEKHSNSPTSRSLFGVKRKLVAAPAYLNANPAIESLQDLQSLNWVVLFQVHAGSVVLQNARREKKTIRPQSRLSSNDAVALFRLAFAGAGLAALPDFLVDAHLKSGAMVEIFSEWKPIPITVYA